MMNNLIPHTIRRASASAALAICAALAPGLHAAGDNPLPDAKLSGSSELSSGTLTLQSGTTLTAAAGSTVDLEDATLTLPPGAGGGATAFTDLTDTPATLGSTGQMLYAVPGGMTWADPIYTVFTDLEDTPASYTAGYLLRVNSTADGIEYVAPSAGGVTDLTDLDDTPATLGAAGQVLAVNAGATATEWVDAGGVASGDHPDAAPASPGSLDDEFDDDSFSGWTWYNQGTSTVKEEGGVLVFTPEVASSSNTRGFVKSAPSTPYTATAKMRMFPAAGLSDYNRVGVVLRESATGKQLYICLNIVSGGTDGVAVQKYSDNTTFAGEEYATPTPLAGYLRVQDDGTDVTLSYSLDGFDYSVAHTEARGTFFTSAPDQVGIFGISRSSSGLNAMVEWFRSD